ncbi:LCP family protein [Pseudobacteroides cellulosolvens]|uniref:Cell envelope-related transcriptional attenuator n=1 Tax=Pseudobacteroides cellulosolvens ATCC 35603 = DSM 2933 TaxID=398512 RepID=A0A0L6JXH3_9FIRM|nr:LCP family protein [Pseudobacteroides cellulosolvens]KNY30265.1 cell envelope-related transcriptional attenuator [Pseudobacteroides cellulosolvens ATCC 35603 = DSM 2933]
MKCNNFDDIVLYVDGALSDEAAKCLVDHMKDCEDCRQMVDTLINANGFLKDEATADKSIDDKVLNSIDKSRYTDKKSKFKLFCQLHVFKRALKPAAAVVFICMVFLYLGYGKYFTDNVQSGTGPAKDTSQPVNILVLGNDSYKNTDAIILINYDLINAQMNLLSIPRDTSVNLNGSQTKLSHVYHVGGPGVVSKAVSDLLKVDIQYYVCFDTIAAQKSIDLLDGVDFNSPFDLDYDDPIQNLHIHIKKGQNHLAGKQAIEFMRFRKMSHYKTNLLNYYNGSDLKRIEAQQNMLKALIEQKLNVKYIAKFNEIFKTISSSSETNISLGDGLNLIKNLHKLNTADVNMFILPGKVQIDSSIFYYTIDNEASQNIVKSYFQSGSK